MATESRPLAAEAPPTTHARANSRDETVVRVGIAIGFLIVALIVLFPFLGTRYVTRDDSEVAVMTWRDIKTMSLYMARVSGRIYFIVGFWFGWIPYAIDSFRYFKAVQMLGLLGNFIALYYVAWKVGRSWILGLLALLVALATTQSRWDHNIIAAYPWAFSTSLTLSMLAIGLFADFLDTGSKRSRFLSAAAFFLSLLTYESFLLYAVAFPALAWPRAQSLRRALTATLKSIWPQVVAGSLYIGAYLAFRIAYPPEYSGTSVQISPGRMFAVWKAFTLSALPATAYSDLPKLLDEFSDAYVGYEPGVAGLAHHLRIEWVVLMAVVLPLCAWLVNRAASEKTSRLGRGALVGLLMSTLPQLPHMLSAQYQDWVVRVGVRSHVPTYFAGFGVALLLAFGVSAVAKATHGTPLWTWSVAAILAWIALLTAFSNFYVARSQTVARRQFDLVDFVIHSEQFAALPDDAVVWAPTWWRDVYSMSVLDDYWTRYARLRTGRPVRFVRTLSEFHDVCKTWCPGRAWFAAYNRDTHGTNHYMLLAPMEGDPHNGLFAPFVDAFVLSQSRMFGVFARLSGSQSNNVMVNGESVGEFDSDAVWAVVDRRGNHGAPLTFRLSTFPGKLDPHSIVLSSYDGSDGSIEPVQAIFARGFYGEERSATSRWQWGERQATLVLENASSSPRDVTVSFDVAGTTPSCHVFVEAPRADGILLQEHSSHYRFTVRIDGWQDRTLEFRSDCPRTPADPRDLRFNVSSVRLAQTLAGVTER